MSSSWALEHGRRTSIAAALLLLLALAFRLANLGWQLPHYLHSDESPQVENAINQAARGNFDTSYHNQPPAFRNLLTIEILALDRLGLMGGSLAEMDDLSARDGYASTVIQRAYLLGRATSAAFGAATVVVLFLATRLLLGAVAAAFSSVALALSLTHIRESHFATTTVPGLFFAALALYYSSLYVKQGGRMRLVAACVAAGLAVATRDLMLAAALFPIAAALIRSPRLHDWRWWLQSTAITLTLFGAAVAAFVLFTPYERVVAEQTGMLIHLPKLSRDIPSAEHIAEVMTFYGGVLAQSLGIPMLALSAVGIVRMAARRQQALLLNAAFPIAIVVALIFNRYAAARFAIPLELFLCVSAGYGLAGLVHGLQRARAARWAQCSAALLPFASLLINAGVLTWLMGNKDTRVLAHDWTQENLPASSTVYAPRFSLPGARDDNSSNTRVSLAAIRPDQIPMAFTGEGCGEYVALSSVEYDLTESASASQANATRDFVRSRGSLVARFSPWRARERPTGPDDGFAPLWNLYELARPGPIIEIYAMSPACADRLPGKPLTELVALSESSSSQGLRTLKDPRFEPQTLTRPMRADGLPRGTRGMAVGRFIPGDSGLAMAAVVRDRDEDHLAMYRLGADHPPQLVMLDRQFVDCNCVSSQGLATVPSENGGLDQLAMMSVEQGVERIELVSFHGSTPARTHRWTLVSPEGIPASALASVPADLQGARRLGLLYLIGSQLRVRVLNPDLSLEMLNLRDGSMGMYEFRLPSNNSDYLPQFAIGDFDGNGRNDVALADISRQEVQVFRMPPTEPGQLGSLAHLQTRGSGERTQFLQALSPEAWSTRPPSPRELLALDWVGNELQLIELSIDPVSPYPLRVEAAPGIAVSSRSNVVGLAEGRFLKHEPFPSVALMTQEGRAVTLELYRRATNGALADTGIVLDRWRTEPDDRPLRNSLAAVDLDGDGIDELANGRLAGVRQDIQEFHFHTLTVTPQPAANLVRIDREMVPAGAEFTAISRLPRDDRGSGNLAVAYRTAERDTVGFIDVRADVPTRLLRESSWVSDTGRLSGLAALPADGDGGASMFVIVERGHAGQNLVRVVTMPGSQLELTRPFAWPNIRDRGVWVTAGR